jgi:hypothetical protein
MHIRFINLGAFMRRFISLLAACSGLALATSVLGPSQIAAATEIKTESQIAAVNLESQAVPSNQTKVVCSRNRPLALRAEGVKVASGISPQGPEWSSNIIKLFCRDVRINTIVVRDYCALIRN